MANGLVPMGDEPLLEDVRDVVAFLVWRWAAPPAEKWVDEMRAQTARESLDVLL
jgi:hypothetical protein